MKQFDRVRAMFIPRRRDDLQNGAEQIVGHTFDWQAVWVIERGPYRGEWAMAPRETLPLGVHVAWVPRGDLLSLS